MKILNSKEILDISGASTSASATFDVKLKDTQLDQLPLIASLANDCVKYKWDANKFTHKMIDAGIDPNNIAIETTMHFYKSFHDYD